MEGKGIKGRTAKKRNERENQLQWNKRVKHEFGKKGMTGTQKQWERWKWNWWRKWGWPLAS